MTSSTVTFTLVWYNGSAVFGIIGLPPNAATLVNTFISEFEYGDQQDALVTYALRCVFPRYNRPVLHFEQSNVIQVSLT